MEQEFNFMTDSNYVKIFDTTLRDGEQSPGATMNIKEKLELARQLEQLRVDVMEAGFPVASPGDFEAVHLISKEIKKVKVCALARCLNNDIDVAAKALEPAEDNRIHVFIATSEIHRKYKFNKAQSEILDIAVKGVRRAVSLVNDVEFSAEDATRTELPFLAAITEAVIEAGAKTINIPDTVGYTTPFELIDIITYLKKNVPNINEAVLSIHCHDDLGLSVANSLAAVKAGARQVECTINGIGERAGNCSMEEIVMALKTRKRYFGFDTRVVTNEFYKISRMVSNITGMLVQPNKAIVGTNAFAHEAGIHQDGVLKNRQTYEIMNPKDVGWGESELVLGKHSGRHAFENRLNTLGYTLDKASLDKAFFEFKVICDKKKFVYDDDLFAIVKEISLNTNDLFSLESVRMNYLFNKTNKEEKFPEVEVVIKDKSGAVLVGKATARGPIEAIFNAMIDLLDIDVSILNYNIRSVTRGKDALGEVTVKVSPDNCSIVIGRAASTDILEASAKAFLHALNRMLKLS